MVDVILQTTFPKPNLRKSSRFIVRLVNAFYIENMFPNSIELCQYAALDGRC